MSSEQMDSLIDSNGPTPMEGESRNSNVEDTVECGGVQTQSSTQEVDLSKKRQRSKVWLHFKKQKIEGKMKAICNYCGAKLLGDPKQGTSHLREHWKSCKLRTTRDIRQSLLRMTSGQSVGDNQTITVGAYSFNQEVARHSLARMIILHEYPIVMAEHHGFKQFCSDLQPLFKCVTRNTVRSDILQLYECEKARVMKLLSKNESRIAITTDMWTATTQNKGYMAITAHYIDDCWTLKSRLVRFIYVPAPHTAEVLSDVLVQCLMDWNIDRKLSTLTLDNCTTNDALIERILEKLPPISFILHGKLFHMRCCAHILNLIVKDGLLIISNAIEKIRESVNYWSATPKREERFKETCEQLGMSYLKRLIYDCKTRWNSTYLMLDVAISYKDVFNRLVHREPQYKSLPSEYEWEMAKEICDKLSLFYKVTELFSGTLYPTSNVYFPKICQIRLALREWLACSDETISKMASTMIIKFDKYWGVINGVMAVGTILDPRYKMMLLNYFFPKIYGVEAEYEIRKVKIICQDLVNEYENMNKDIIVESSSSRATNVGSAFIEGNDDWEDEYTEYVDEQSENLNTKSELDIYLEEKVLPKKRDDSFDILGWWKSNGLKYPTLQKIARDFLAIPISTVASESAFSTGGRFLTPHRSRLLPETVEALMCCQNWISSDIQVSTKLKSSIEFLSSQDDQDVGFHNYIRLHQFTLGRMLIGVMLFKVALKAFVKAVSLVSIASI